MTEFYSQDDVQQILQVAIARQAYTEELTRGQMMEIAADLGISPVELQLAEQEWIAHRQEMQERQAFNLYRQGQFRQHLIKYLIVNIFLVVLDLFTSGGVTWSTYVVLGWGLGLALDAWKTYQTDSDDHENAFQNWRRKRQIKRTVNTFLDRWLKAS